MPVPTEESSGTFFYNTQFMIKITPEPYSFNLSPSLSIFLIKGSLIGYKAGNS